MGTTCLTIIASTVRKAETSDRNFDNYEVLNYELLSRSQVGVTTRFVHSERGLNIFVPCFPGN